MDCSGDVLVDIGERSLEFLFWGQRWHEDITALEQFDIGGISSPQIRSDQSTLCKSTI